MKPRGTVVVLFSVLLLLLLGAGLSCTRARSDAQIAQDIQGKVNSDPGLQGNQLTIHAANGVITLSGTVDSEMERASAANLASQVDGVKTVVNNLQVAPLAAAAEPVEEFSEERAAPPARREAAPARRTTPRRTQTPSTPRKPERVYEETPSASTATNASEPAPTAPAAKSVTIPEGTTVSVRLIDPVDSETNQVGDTFAAALDSPVMVDGEVVVPDGVDAQLKLGEVKSAGRFKGQSEVVLELIKLSYGGNTYQLRANEWRKQGGSRGKRTAATVGGGAALGAIIGGIAGGGKGAAIGAAVGAGAGTGVQAATKGQQIKLAPETLLHFQLAEPVTVVASASREVGRKRLE
jgi:hypothetical protein